MAYTIKNFKTKKSLREAIGKGDKVKCYQPGFGPDLSTFNGVVYLEGPHYPAPHTWYAEAVLFNGIIVKLK